MNLPTLIVLLLVIAALVVAIAAWRRAGRTCGCGSAASAGCSCGCSTAGRCNCSGCPMSCTK